MDDPQEKIGKSESLRVFDDRIAQLEGEAETIRNRIASVRSDFDRFTEVEQLRAENELMKQAILRYAVACGSVDLQVVLLRARGDSIATMENFQRVTEEQNDASNALRTLAREFLNIGG